MTRKQREARRKLMEAVHAAHIKQCGGVSAPEPLPHQLQAILDDTSGRYQQVAAEMRECQRADEEAEQLAREMMAFVSLQDWLIARFGVRDEAVAQRAMLNYRDTLDKNILQIHVLRQERAAYAPSFVISAAAQEELWAPGFLRWRYPSLEEEAGQYANCPTMPTILQAWDRPAAVFFTTTTQIASTDSASFFLAQRDQYRQWRLVRAYQLECPPDSRDWGLGNDPLTHEVLPGVAKLDVPEADLTELLDAHGELVLGTSPNAFRRSHSILPTARALLERIQGTDFDCRDPMQFAAKLDQLLAVK